MISVVESGYHGIEGGDVELGEFSYRPCLFVGVSLPPKFVLCRKINVRKCKIDVEEAVNKLIWNKLMTKDEINKSAVEELIFMNKW